ncbi:iron ABC transporter permease, partial [Alkalibaculum bacchi]|uniref:FecCD family ABC transporter permease n=1 Tax=Alkalibaculum bacchi TaxID=645887 RepID=UPI0026F14DE1
RRWVTWVPSCSTWTSPYTLGVSNGAALGASIAIVFSSILGAAAYSPYIIPIFAFAFATITMLLVFGISKISRNATWTLLLGGVAIGYLMSSLTSLIKYMADTVKLPELVFWSLGSLTGLPWEAIFIMLGMAVISNVFMLYYALDLNAMPLGEETAVSLGINYKKMRQLSFIFATLMTAVSVAFTGVIGFVGLVAPHLSRMIIGNDFRLQVWTSGIIGGLLLLISDTVARTIIAPTELPVGIITSVLGVPFFLFLIVKRGRE